MDESKKKLQINIDRQLSEEAQTVLTDIGLSQTTAITAFYKQLVAQGGMPFALKQTPEQRANLALQQAAATRPIEDLTDKKKLEAWLNDESQDY